MGKGDGACSPGEHEALTQVVSETEVRLDLRGVDGDEPGLRVEHLGGGRVRFRGEATLSLMGMHYLLSRWFFQRVWAPLRAPGSRVQTGKETG